MIILLSIKEIKMDSLNGYVENISELAYYTFKKLVRPGDRVSLDHIYDVAIRNDKNLKKDESFLEFVKDRFNDGGKWKIVFDGITNKQDVKVVSSTGKRRGGKVRSVGGALETSSTPETAAEAKSFKDMSHVTGLAVEVPPTEITSETLLDCEDLGKLEKMIKSLKGKRERDRIVKGAMLLASNRGKDVHYRTIKKIIEKLAPMEY
jgi:hypothetical protein